MKNLENLITNIIRNLKNTTDYHYEYSEYTERTTIYGYNYNVIVEDFDVEENDGNYVATRYVYVKMAFVEISYIETLYVNDNYIESVIDEYSMVMSIEKYPF